MGHIKAKTHLQKLGFSDKDKKSPDHDRIQTWVYNNIETIIAETIMKKTKAPYEIHGVEWEYPLVYQTPTYKTVVGFIDIYLNIHGEFYFTDTKKYELFAMPVFIEVKTSIPSLGELIRQMKTYQTYHQNNARYMIIAPDETHKKILNDQGFWFYKYNDPTKLF